MHPMFRRALPVAVYAFVACAALNAQQAAPSPRTVWDGAYTDAQAERARGTFNTRCANCHQLSLPDGPPVGQVGAQGGPVVGPKFWKNFQQRTVGEMLAWVSKNMPNGAQAGTLPAQTYADLVALILKVNDFPAGSVEVAPETVADIRIQPKDGPGELPAGVLVRVVGCLERNGTDWELTRATAPERIDQVGPGPADATRPLAGRSYTLKFVLTRLDRNVGQRMSVSGLLIGTGGILGINVSQVSRVADACP